MHHCTMFVALTGHSARHRFELGNPEPRNPSLALGMGSEVPDFPAQIYAGRSGQSMPQTLCSDAFSKFFGKASRAAGRVIPAPTNSDIALCATWLPFQCRLFSGGNSP